MKLYARCSVTVSFVNSYPFKRDTFDFHVPLMVLWFRLFFHQSHDLIVNRVFHAFMRCACRMLYV